jgi:hypothetical protein
MMADVHITAGIDHAAGPDTGGHWLVTFAIPFFALDA